MNESGIWTGLLNNKLGTFKFINVNIIEKYSNFINTSTKTLNKCLSIFEDNDQNEPQNLKSLTLSSLFPSSNSLTSINTQKHSISNNIINIPINNNDNYSKLIEGSKISNSSLINEILNRTKLKVKKTFLILFLFYSTQDFIFINNKLPQKRGFIYKELIRQQ
jgi:hypothetical protein